MRVSVRRFQRPSVLSLLLALAVVGCQDAAPLAPARPPPTRSITPNATAPAPCLAVSQELWAEEREFFTDLEQAYPGCPIGAATDSSRALTWVHSGGSQLAIVSGGSPEQGAKLIRTVPFALVAHVTSPFDDVPLSWVQDVFQQGGRYTTVVVGDGTAEKELLDIERLAGDAVKAPSWQQAKELVTRDRRALALLPWQVVDFHVKVLAIEGHSIVSERPGDYPHVRRWWLVGSLQEYSEISTALEEGLAYQPELPVSLLAVGDVMLGRGVGSLMAANSPAYPFLSVQELTAQADIAFANLECSISSRGAPEGVMAFRARPQAAEGLAYAGFDVISLANNHSDDYGEPALLDTLTVLEDQGIAYVGAGRSVDEAHSPLVLAIEGLKIAFLAYNQVEPRYTGSAAGVGGPAWLDPEVVYEDVRKARAEAEFVVVSFHWGTEYIVRPDDFQQEVAHRAVEAGADLVLGHHSHVLGGVAFLDAGFVAYSLGNFVFDQSWSVETKQGLIVHSLIGAKGLKQVRLIPVQIEAGRPEVLTWPEARSVLADVFRMTDNLRGLPGGSETGSGHVELGGHLALDWATEFEGQVTALGAGDLQFDGEEEVLVGTVTATGPGVVSALNADGSIAWQFETQDQVQDLDSGDLDADGRVEVIAATGLVDTPGWIHTLDSDGRLRWQYGVEASVNTLALGGVGADGRLAVVGGEWGSFDDTVYLLEADGSLRWKYQTAGSVNATRVGDVDGDGRAEVAVGADDVYLLGRDGRQLWRYSTGGYVNDLALGDLKGDSVQEIVAVTAHPGPGILVLSGNADRFWWHEVKNSLEAVVTGDVDGDGRDEVLTGSVDGNVYLLDDAGDLRWEYQVGGPIGDLILADANGDGAGELVVGTGDYLSLGKVLVLDVSSPSLLGWYEGPTGVSALHAADVDGDGRDEMLVGTGGGEVLCLGWAAERTR